MNIRIVQFFIIIAIRFLISCNVDKSDIIELRKIPVVIKFDIPNDTLVNSIMSSKELKFNKEKIQKAIPFLHKFDIINYFKFEKKINYWELNTEIDNELIKIFAFEQNGKFYYKGIKCDSMVNSDTRYFQIENGISLYKKIIFEKSLFSLCVSFNSEKRISIHRDDRFSKW